MNIIKMDDMHIEDVTNLEQEIFESPYSKNAIIDMLNSQNYCYLVCFERCVLGYVGINVVLDECDITHIAVAKESRRKNIATKLIAQLVEYCVQQNITKIHLEVRQSNSQAIALYEKNGFKSVGLRKNYYRNPAEHALLMTLEV